MLLRRIVANLEQNCGRVALFAIKSAICLADAQGFRAWCQAGLTRKKAPERFSGA